MRVEQKITTDPNARVNPLVEKQIQVLEAGGDLSSVFRDEHIQIMNQMGKERYLAHLKELRQSLAEEHYFGGE